MLLRLLDELGALELLLRELDFKSFSSFPRNFSSGIEELDLEGREEVEAAGGAIVSESGLRVGGGVDSLGDESALRARRGSRATLGSRTIPWTAIVGTCIGEPAA